MKKQSLVLVMMFIIVYVQTNIYAQTLYNGVGHIPAQYQLDWHQSGLLYDATTIEPKQVFQVTYIINDIDLTPIINSAKNFVNNTNGLAIIYFPSGDYFINTPIELTQNHRNIIFQGEGSDKTRLIFKNMKDSPCFNIHGTSGDWYDLNQNFNKGNSIIYSSDFGDISNTNWVHFVQYRFDYHSDNSDDEDIVGQITRIEEMAGNWARIKDKANRNYLDGGDLPAENSLIIRRITPIKNIGIENLKILRYPNIKSSSASLYNIRIEFAVNCWIKGVESEMAACSHIDISRSSHCEISGCYLHEAMDYGGGGWGYGAVVQNSSTNCLIENNIFRKLRHALVAGSGSNCNVWTFNYSREQKSTIFSPTNRDLDLHAKYPFGHLFEHNWVDKIASDDYHGDNGPYNAFVRNRSLGTVTIERMHYWSTLGNIEDGSPLNAAFHHWESGCYPIKDIFAFFNGYSYNHNWCWGHFDDYYGILNDVSYYYSTRPDFLPAGEYTWPALGPKTSAVGALTQSIPAKARFGLSKKTYLPNPTPKPVSTSGTLQYDQTWTNGHTLTGNVIVPSNVILTIAAGATINLGTSPNYYYIKCEGSGAIVRGQNVTVQPRDIQIPGFGQFNTIQQAVSSAWQNHTILLGPGTYTGNVSITNVSGIDIRGDETSNIPWVMPNRVINGNVAFLNSSYYESKLSGLRINGDVEFNYGNNFVLDRCFIDGELHLLHSNNISLCDFACMDGGTGIYLDFSYLVTAQTPGINIVGNQCEGMFCRSYVQNSVFNNVHFFDCMYGDVNTQYSSNSTICFWLTSSDYGGGFSCPSYRCSISDPYNDVTVNLWRQTPTNIKNHFNGLSKTGKSPFREIWEQIFKAREPDPTVVNDPGEEAYQSVSDRYFSILDEGVDFKNRPEKIQPILEGYETVYKNYMGKPSSIQSLDHIIDILCMLDKHDEANEWISEALNDKKLNDMKYEVEQIKLKIDIGKGDFKKALQNIDKLADKTDKDQEKSRLQYLKAVLYKADQNDEEGADKMLEKLVEKYPRTSYAWLAMRRLNNYGLAKEGDSQEEVLPFSYCIQNHPNPFNPTTDILYSLPEACHVTIRIYDVNGREVMTLTDADYKAGHHQALWDATDQRGLKVSSGVYIYQITTSTGFQQSQRMVLLK